MKYFWGILFTCLFIGHGWAVSVTNASATAGLSAPVMGSLTVDDAEKIRMIATLENDLTILDAEILKCEKSKKGVFGSIIISSAIFGAMHLLNLLGGFNPYVFLQVGYSFLIGAVCGFALIVCGNIFVPILLHAIFDFGGFFLSEGIATGRLWTLPNIIWTAVFSIAMATAIIAIFFKNDFSGIYQRLNLDRLPEEEGEGRK